MKKIMFVCHGNICRSPMAEMIFKDMVERSGLKDKIYVASSATSDEEIHRGVGNPIYPPAAAELVRHGYRVDGRRAVRLLCGDYEKYDLFVGMDERNIVNMKRIFGHDRDEKIKKLMDFTPRGGDVVDPWYYGNFDVTFDDIEEGCRCLFEKIIKS